MQNNLTVKNDEVKTTLTVIENSANPYLMSFSLVAFQDGSSASRAKYVSPARIIGPTERAMRRNKFKTVKIS
jgi:hypothetical protein